jgi:MoaA/NifB/PqqE/SkfB family radical SAM enzyme
VDIASLRAPICVCWQLTRECDLACLHCCTESAPGRGASGELDSEEAARLASDVRDSGIPYVILAGGEPLLSPHFWAVAESLGRSGIFLKVETNGQRLTRETALRLASLPVRSVQVSLDGATEQAYRGLRPGASLEAALAAAREVRSAGLPLEVSFAPCRANVSEAEAVVRLSERLGAFRFNTGMLMRVGNAARHFDRLVPSEGEYAAFFGMLERLEIELAGRIEICFRPRSIEDALREHLSRPPATLLILPDGLVKVSAALNLICADLRTMSLRRAWHSYLAAWERLRAMDSRGLPVGGGEFRPLAAV